MSEQHKSLLAGIVKDESEWRFKVNGKCYRLTPVEDDTTPEWVGIQLTIGTDLQFSLKIPRDDRSRLITGDPISGSRMGTGRLSDPPRRDDSTFLSNPFSENSRTGQDPETAEQKLKERALRLEAEHKVRKRYLADRWAKMAKADRHDLINKELNKLKQKRDRIVEAESIPQEAEEETAEEVVARVRRLLGEDPDLSEAKAAQGSSVSSIQPQGYTVPGKPGHLVSRSQSTATAAMQKGKGKAVTDEHVAASMNSSGSAEEETLSQDNQHLRQSPTSSGHLEVPHRMRVNSILSHQYFVEPKDYSTFVLRLVDNFILTKLDRFMQPEYNPETIMRPASLYAPGIGEAQWYTLIALEEKLDHHQAIWQNFTYDENALVQYSVHEEFERIKQEVAPQQFAIEVDMTDAPEATFEVDKNRNRQVYVLQSKYNEAVLLLSECLSDFNKNVETVKNLALKAAEHFNPLRGTPESMQYFDHELNGMQRYFEGLPRWMGGLIEEYKLLVQHTAEGVKQQLDRCKNTQAIANVMQKHADMSTLIKLLRRDSAQKIPDFVDAYMRFAKLINYCDRLRDGDEKHHVFLTIWHPLHVQYLLFLGLTPNVPDANFPNKTMFDNYARVEPSRKP